MNPAKKDEAPEKPELKVHTEAEKAAEKGVVPKNEGLEMVLDIPLKVSVELGRTRILVQDLLKLHKGAVLELAKGSGEPLDVLVNDRVVARGEVIVTNEKFGIRLTDIVSHSQRIRQLGE